MDNVRNLTTLLVAKNKLLESFKNSNSDAEKIELQEQISKCKEILPEGLSDKLSSIVDSLVNSYDVMTEAEDLDEADVKKANDLHLELDDLCNNEIYTMYLSNLKTAYLNGELTEEEINDLKSNDFLTDEEKELITKAIEEVKAAREIGDNVENAEQQSMEEDKKGNENTSVSLTDFYNDLQLFNTFFDRIKNDLSNGILNLEELDKKTKEFKDFEVYYDGKIKKWNIPINQLSEDMLSMFAKIAKTRSDILNMMINERQKLEEKAEPIKEDSLEQQTKEEQGPTLASMISAVSYDSDAPVKVQVEKMIIEHDLHDINAQIEKLLAIKAEKEANNKHLSIKEAIELHKLTTTKIGLEKMLSDVSNLNKLQEFRENRIGKYDEKIEKQENKRSEAFNEKGAQESQLGKWISDKKLERLDEKLRDLKNKKMVALDKQKSAVTISYDFRLKILKVKAAFSAYKDFATNVIDESKKIVHDGKNKYKSTKTSLSSKLEALKNMPIFMKQRPAIVDLPEGLENDLDVSMQR